MNYRNKFSELKNIFDNKTKPDVSNYNINELKWIIFNYNKSYCKESNLEIENIEIKNIENIENIEKMNKLELIKIINNLWFLHPIQNNIECLFCLNIITNGDNLITNCGHLYHSTCFFNYLFNSFNHELNKSVNITNYFRCPKCRNYLSNQINDSNNTNEYENENIIDNLNNNITIDLITGMWIPIHENQEISILSEINTHSDSD